MLFNSFEFAVFMPLVFALYWGLARWGTRPQNALLLVASYLFYGWWDWRFLSLIFLSSLLDFALGLAIDRSDAPTRRRALMWTSVGVNLGILGVFKYYNFFADALTQALRPLGVEPGFVTLRLILPVGISFYTFQTLSYTLDIYRGRMRATSDWLGFFTFVAFFPQLVAGPIERAANLLPQFAVPRRYDRALAHDGLRQILWGLFKKVVIADNLAESVDHAFKHYSELPSGEIALGVAMFAIQIYCDFSAYSEIARGTARLLGFELMQNFAFPYFSRNIAEFWHRWHISLSTWFRDYLYIPLGGNRVPMRSRIRNVLTTFTISGLWHGASWTFVAWGLFHGLCFIPLYLTGRNRIESEVVAKGRWLPSLGDALRMTATFALVLVGWVFFRADSLTHAFDMLRATATNGFALPLSRSYLLPLGAVAVLMGVEWIHRDKEHGLDVAAWPAPARWAVYYGLIACIFLIGSLKYVPFIYFQF